MPHLYPHNTKGWRVVFRVHFPDGTHVDRTRYSRQLQNAQIIYGDVDMLESLSRKRHITTDEVRRAVNLGYITPEEASLLTGHNAAGVFTWDQLRKKYEDWGRAHTEKTTFKCNLSKLRLVEAFFSQFDPAEVTVDHVRRYIEQRKAGLVKTEPKKRGRKIEDRRGKEGSIRKELVILRHLLDPLGEENNPARAMPLLKVEEENIPRPLYPEEIGVFLEALEARKDKLGGWLKHMTLIYLYAGLRPSEILRLRPDDINFQAEKIHIQGRTKTGLARSVDIHPVLRPYLDETLKATKKGERLFTCEVNSLGREIRRVIAKAGLKGIKPYSLRHTFVTYLLRAGADLRKTMDLAGHRKLETTTRYLHVVPSIDSPVNKIDFGQGANHDPAKGK